MIDLKYNVYNCCGHDNIRLTYLSCTLTSDMYTTTDLLTHRAVILTEELMMKMKTQFPCYNRCSVSPNDWDPIEIEQRACYRPSE